MKNRTYFTEEQTHDNFSMVSQEKKVVKKHGSFPSVPLYNGIFGSLPKNQHILHISTHNLSQWSNIINQGESLRYRFLIGDSGHPTPETLFPIDFTGKIDSTYAFGSNSIHDPPPRKRERRERGENEKFWACFFFSNLRPRLRHV